MQLAFLGAAGTVTGSKFLVTSGSTRVLVDCGLYQGLKELRQRNRDPVPVDPGSLDAVLLTHAHIDHSGYLPVLVREGFKGPIYCTAPTSDLGKILLEDSARIQEEEAWYANKKGFSKHEIAYPLYNVEDARRVFDRFRTVRFDEPLEVGGLSITYRVAGHILGAASIRIEDRATSVLFSGDLGRPADAIIPAPVDAADADWIVMESTYGDREHPDQDPVQTLGEIVAGAARQGGKVLISAFAVGRAQMILYHLARAFEQGISRRVPVYLDSPMAADVTELYVRHHEFHRLSQDECVAMCRSATFLRTQEQSRTLNGLREPAVIVSASGMLSGGRILHHLKRLARYPEHTIVLPGFQAPGTRGADLIAGADSIKIHGDRFRVRATILALDQFSAHADRSDLLRWLGSTPRRPRGVFLVHGEPDAARHLKASIEEGLDFPVQVAEDQSRVDLSDFTLPAPEPDA